MDVKHDQNKSLFYRWFLNNKTVTTLLVILLLLLIVFMVSKVSFIFAPFKVIFSAVGAPLMIAGVFYYFLNPVVDLIERKLNVKRTIIILCFFLALLALLIWGLAVFIPWFGEQIRSFVSHVPGYWHSFTQISDELLKDNKYPQVNTFVTELNDSLGSWFSTSSSEYAKQSINSVSSILGSITKIGISLVTFPVMLFYMLKDGHRLPVYLTSFLPKKAQPSFRETLTDINHQIANYIRGQLSVAFAVMIMFGIGFTIIDLPYGLFLAVLAGLFNLIPYIGSFLAMLPALAVALSVSPVLFVQAVLVFAVEQVLEGHVISPKLLGDSLEIYPVTVLVVLLSAGNLFGLPGVILGIPGYAVMKVLLTKFYQWWRKVSGLYKEDEIKAVELKPQVDQTPTE